MKRLADIYALGLLGIILTVMISSCSDLQEELPVASKGRTIHPEGWMTVSSLNFHGQEIRRLGWSMKSCTMCHGGSYTGGVSRVSCMTCHTAPDGPENCATCHGSPQSPAPPRDLSKNTSTSARGVGAHQIHLIGSIRAAAATCAECHVVPSRLDSPGHVDNADSRAEVKMNNYLANYATNVPGRPRYNANLPTVIPVPAYTPATGSCSNTYCHGAFKNGNVNNVVVWTNPATAACGTCHGDPTRPTLAERSLPKTSAQGGNHPNILNCAACHGDVVNPDLTFRDPSKHINGRLNVFGIEQEY